MRENFDRLSKNLAGGMSRREAFWRFFAGALAIVGVVTPAAAQHRIPFNGLCTLDPPGPPEGQNDGHPFQCEPCAQFCADLYGRGTPDFVECIAASKACLAEECGFRAYNSWMCVSAY
jgi:hypothetical protein